MAKWQTTGLAVAACLLAASALPRAGWAADAGKGSGSSGSGSSGSGSARSGSSGSGSAASSPLSRWFGGGGPPGTNAPVDLTVRVPSGDETLQRTLRNASLIQGAIADGRLSGQDILAAARADYARLLATLYDNGLYGATIDIRLDGREAAGIAPLDAPAVVRRAEVIVQTGPTFHYSRAAIAPIVRGTDLPRDYRTGGVARISDMKAAAKAGVDAWRGAGHAKAKVEASDIVADHAVESVDSRIALNPGPAVRFGRLIATGNHRLRSERLQAIAGFPTGRRYDPELLDEVRKRLRRSGVFSAITLREAEFLGPGDTLDVNLTVIEQKLRRVGGGFEYSSVDGAMVSGYWMHRNLFGGAERLRVDGKVKDIGSGTSGLDYSFSVRLDRPATFRPDLTGYVTLSAERLREEDYDQDLGVVGTGLTWLPNDRLSGDVGLEYRHSRVIDKDDGATNFTVLALPASVTVDRRETEVNDARRGWWAQASATPFLGFGDTDSGLRLLGEGRAYRSFGASEKLTLAGRARAGSIWGSDLAGTPRDYLFYSGGGGSVRGQPYESLGVEVLPGPEGPIKTGGLSVANVTGEIRYQIREKIGVAAFADAGRVWADGGFAGATDWHAGAGLGVRYRTPIGPLRLDVAGPVGGDTGKGMQLYLGLGQAF